MECSLLQHFDAPEAVGGWAFGQPIATLITKSPMWEHYSKYVANHVTLVMCDCGKMDEKVFILYQAPRFPLSSVHCQRWELLDMSLTLLILLNIGTVRIEERRSTRTPELPQCRSTVSGVDRKKDDGGPCIELQPSGSPNDPTRQPQSR